MLIKGAFWGLNHVTKEENRKWKTFKNNKKIKKKIKLKILKRKVVNVKRDLKKIKVTNVKRSLKW